MRRSFLYHPSGEQRLFVDDEIEKHLSDGWYNSPGEAEQSLTEKPETTNPRARAQKNKGATS